MGGGRDRPRSRVAVRFGGSERSLPPTRVSLWPTCGAYPPRLTRHYEMIHGHLPYLVKRISASPSTEVACGSVPVRTRRTESLACL